MPLNAGAEIPANTLTIDPIEQAQRDRNRNMSHLMNRMRLLKISSEFIIFLPTTSMETYSKMIDEIVNDIKAWGGKQKLPILGVKIAEAILQEVVDLSEGDVDNMPARQQKKYKATVTPIKEGFNGDKARLDNGDAQQLVEALELFKINEVTRENASAPIKFAIIKQLESFRKLQLESPYDAAINLLSYQKETVRIVNHLHRVSAAFKVLGIKNIDISTVTNEEAVRYVNYATEMKKSETLKDLSVINAQKLSTDYKIDLSRNSLVEIKRLNAQKSTAAAVKEKKHSRYVDYTPKEISLVKVPPRHNESMVCPNPFKKSYVTEELALAFIKETHADDKRIHPYKCVCGATHIGH